VASTARDYVWATCLTALVPVVVLVVMIVVMIAVMVMVVVVAHVDVPVIPGVRAEAARCLPRPTKRGGHHTLRRCFGAAHGRTCVPRYDK
jgi:hypothetical protein